MTQFNVKELNTIFYALSRLQRHEQSELENAALRKDVSPSVLLELANRAQVANDLSSKVEDMIYDMIKPNGEIVD
jgi:hypothetical protein